MQCLASQKATGSTASVLTTLFGGAINNEGIGLFNFSFDWQYVSVPTTTIKNLELTKWNLPDYLIQHVFATEVASALSRRIPHLLLGHAWYLLQQRLGSKVASLYVDVSALR